MGATFFMGYAQIARHNRLQPLGMGAFTTSQFTRAPPPEQSNEPVPGAGDTHDGGGGGGRHRSEASKYAHPLGQTPASGRNPIHPYAGVRQIWDGEQSALPQAKLPASAEASSTALAFVPFPTVVEMVQTLCTEGVLTMPIEWLEVEALWLALDPVAPPLDICPPHAIEASTRTIAWSGQRIA